MALEIPAPKTSGRFRQKHRGVKVGSFQEAAKFGELLVLSVLAGAVKDVIQLAGEENFRGKTVIDANNPISDQPIKDGVLSYFIGAKRILGRKDPGSSAGQPCGQSS